MDGKRIEDAQKILDWAIESLDLSIKCMAINYKDEKYKVQFFTSENKLIRGVGFSIPKEWIGDTNPMKDAIHDELRSLLINLEQEAKREKRRKPIRTVKAKIAGIKESRDRIPDKVLKEIFPKKLSTHLASERVYSELKQMILSNKLKKGQRLLREKIAQDFDVSETVVSLAFSKLKKDGLVIIKWGKGSFVGQLLKETR